MPIGNRELWACANEVLRQHGDQAPLFVARRIGALALAHDLDGVAAWKGIGARIERLMRAPDRSQSN